MSTPAFPTSPQPLLMSRSAARRFGDRIAALWPEMAERIVTLPEDGALTPDVLAGLRYAFCSVDIYRDTKPFYTALANAPGLQWVQVFSAGVDRPAYLDLQRRGVTLTTASGAGAAAIALSVTAAVLALSRGFLKLIDAQQRRAWEPLRGPSMPNLAGQRATIVGTGPIGREVARSLAFFGVHVTGVRQTPDPVPHCDEVVGFDRLGELLPRTDWLILACPLTPTTQGLVDATALSALPKGAHLLNVSRGPVVVESDLIAALQDGRLAGAYLDVFEQEPLPTQSPLWSLPNVFVSPHTSAAEAGYDERVATIFLDNLARLRDGRPLHNIAIPSEP